MTDHGQTPRAEDLLSVGTRISWGAILGGGLVALAIYFMLTVLGAAVGLTISDRVRPTTLGIGAVVWGVLTLAAALFVGGLITSLFTVGENQVEAVFYGVIMWALVLGLLLSLAGAGIRGGFNGMVGLANIAQAASVPSWETAARESGVSQEAIDELRNKAAAAAKKTAAAVQDPETPEKLTEAATRIAWWAFAGTWVSMLAAAGGAWVGAGPTFRVVAILRPRAPPARVG